MPLHRSRNLHRATITIGLILLISGITGGFLLTFWFLVVLLPVICVSASWMMAWTTQRSRELHAVAAMILTAVFCAWLFYFFQYGAEDYSWYGILLMCTQLVAQTALYLSANRSESNSVGA
jgi:hypothetical protein